MTEVEWLECTDPGKMLVWICGRGSERKLRLFGCACCCEVWSLLANDDCRRLVELSESAADDPALMTELAAAFQRVWTPGVISFEIRKSAPYEAAIYASTFKMLYLTAVTAAAELLHPRKALPAHHCDLLRDIFGFLPFRRATIAPLWLSSSVLGIASTMYDDRGFDLLPILADALEDAGCDNADILAHCRSGGEHVRGCWVVDLLLDKR